MVLLPIMPIHLPINGDERFCDAPSWHDNKEFMTNEIPFANIILHFASKLFHGQKFLSNPLGFCVESRSKTEQSIRRTEPKWGVVFSFFPISNFRGISPHVFQQFVFIFATVGNLLGVRPLGQLELASQYPSWSWYSQRVKFHVRNKLGKCNFVCARMADARMGHQIPPFQRK